MAKKGGEYYPGMGIISRELYDKIQAGEIHPEVIQFDHSTGATLFPERDVAPPAWAVGVKKYFKGDEGAIKR